MTGTLLCRTKKRAIAPQHRSYQKLAPHVPRLDFQFYFASSGRQRDLVRSEDVRRTLNTILEEAEALQEIDHHGVLYQEALEGILEVWSLKVLRVRQSWNDMPSSCSEGETLRPRDYGHSTGVEH